MNRAANRAFDLELPTMALVPAACYAFVGVFTETTPVWQIMGAALISSLLAASLRRLRIPLIVASILSIVGLAMYLTLQFGEGTGYYGAVPSRETLEVARLLSDEGAVQFRELRAPVPSTPAFVALATIGAWVMAMLTDWGAMRLRLAFEPILPAALLFAFASILGVAGNELRATVIFAITVVVWATIQRTLRLRDNQTWLTSDLRRGPAAVARPAAAFGAIAIAGGLLAGPLLPGAQDGELFYWRNGGEPTRFVVSPFVKLDNRLVEQRDVDLFTVVSDQPSYWRIVGLDTFDDGFWRTVGSFTDEDGRLPGDRARPGTTVTISQTFNIQNLADIWLPAAFAPSEIDSEEGVKWNADTGSLSSVGDSADGLAYTVESVVGLFTADELAAAATTVPSIDFAERYLDLPNDITPRLGEEALAITNGATNRFEQAKMLQEHFRGFDYSVNLSARRGDPIEQFLDERVGFCQQFSGVMALMARSLGIPARVAIGFTWGDPVAGEPNTYQITGRHTHAWPELWFGDLGWVAFEPTPGRGSPTTSQYTDAPARLVSDVNQVQPEIDPNNTTPTSDPLDRSIIPDESPNVTTPGASTDSGLSVNLPWRWIALAFAAACYLIGLPALRRLTRSRRQSVASTHAGRVGAAWLDAIEDLDLGFDLTRQPSETRPEFAARCSQTAGVPEELLQLSQLASAARFGPETVTEADVVTAQSSAALTTEAMRDKSSVLSRWLKTIDPTRLIRSLRAEKANEEWVKAA
jgi:transglutaminase-like putative cysteine protease